MSGKQTIRSSLRRAARPATQIPQQCRNFTSTPNRSNSNARGMIARQMGKEKTMASRMSKMKGSEIPDDLGYFPGTLVMPKRSELPQLLSSNFKRRLQIEWRNFWQTCRDFGSTVYQTKWNVKKNPRTNKKMREPMLLSERYVRARELHKSLYTALANGDREMISKIACKGLQAALKNRLDHRRAVNGPQEIWTIKYKGWTPESPVAPWLPQALIPPRYKSTRLIADRMGGIPIGKDGKLRQVTVKIRSEQTLDKNDGTKPVTKEVEEYVVIQQMTIDGVAGEWMMWGTTQPSTPKQIDDMFSDKGKSGLSFIDELKSRMMTQQ